MSKFRPRDKKQRKSRGNAESKAVHKDDGYDEKKYENPNALIILPKTIDEKDAITRRRAEIRNALTDGQGKPSSRKQKRLEKYIDKKLKKEERVVLIERLSQNNVDTSFLISSTDLGVTKESKKTQLRRALRDEKAGLDLEVNRHKLYEERQFIDTMVEDEKEEDTEALAQITTIPEVQNTNNGNHILSIGSGLKRPLESDESGQPLIKKVKRKCKTIQGIVLPTISAEPVVKDGGPWTGFSSEEDEYVISSSGDEERSVSGSSNESSEDVDSSDDDASSQSGSFDLEATKARLRRTGGKSEKASAFKSWAIAQRAKLDDEMSSNGCVAAENVDIDKTTLLGFKPREEEYSPPPPELAITNSNRKVFSVDIDRAEDIQIQRLALPIVQDEQKIMEAVHNNDIVIICGETGSGKTTQLPQFLFEAGYGNQNSDNPGMIGITQPRRVAAVSMCNRVAQELGPYSRKVAYQIRFEGNVNEDTAIKFMTDGVLLREVSEDILLRKYSAIIIDEAHERSINTDILIGVVSRVIKLRREMSEDDKLIKPLKILIMSATLRYSDFSDNKKLFPICPPVVQSDGRQFSVTNRFALRTKPDYVEEAYKKVCRIHKRLPKGGQNEIIDLARRLRKCFNIKLPQKKKDPNVQILAKEAIVETEDIELGGLDDIDIHINDDDDTENSDKESDMGEEEANIDTTDELVILPLYSLLPTQEQLKVFEPLKDNQRLCVLATNIAETSLTIPGIRYVVDSGRAKERVYDKVTGVQSFEIRWISKASAAQRSGRAGRTWTGQCYRLYSSAVFERDFDDFPTAEIARMPLEGVVLQMKTMKIDNVVNFPFPTLPGKESLKAAEKLLHYLGALGSNRSITELGTAMNVFPVAPRFSRMLTVGQQYNCLPYVIAIVAGLSVGELFITEHQLNISLDDDHNEMAEAPDAPSILQKIAETKRVSQRKLYFDAQKEFSILDPSCDILKTLTAICAFDYEAKQRIFCETRFVRYKEMREVRKLRGQLTHIVEINFPGIIDAYNGKLDRPDNIQIRALKQIVATGFIDQVAIRGDLLPNAPIKKNYKKITDTPYFTLFATTTKRVTSVDNIIESAVFLHPSSVLAMNANQKAPDYLVYHQILRASGSSGKVRMKPLTALTGQQLSFLAKGTPLITYSKPLEHPPPQVTPEIEGGLKRECWVIPKFGAAIGKSELGWALPPRKVVQRKAAGSNSWVTE